MSESEIAVPPFTAARRARPRIVVVGGGFAGIATAKALRHCDAEVTVIDRRNHHIFQPLLYQVASSVLAPSDVAAPIRQLAARQGNVSVLLAEVVGIDLESRSIDVEYVSVGTKKVAFDYLVIAAGTQSSYFGHNDFAKYAPCLKTLTDAETIRSKILSAYETAEFTDDAEERLRYMTFVLVGAGPTGVELAASLAQMTISTLRSNFRRIDPANTSIVLLEGGKRVLPSFAESLARRAALRLAKLGVKVVTDAMVEHIDERGVTVGGNRIESGTVLWTAGVAPSPLVKMLGVATDRAGRACVGPNLNLPEDRRVFVIGDAAILTQDGKSLPGVAQVAIQQGRYVGRLITQEIGGRSAPRPFRYFDKGSVAVVGKNFAVMESRRIRLAGFTAWLVWAVIHLMFLPQLQNRRRVQNQWFWSYLTGQRSSRLVAEAPRIVA
ncbi:MAG TPA: NAD(P)/FAD-dependent oxidoreductase [Steroidobacteraceae bacterium]|jgi:NADH dehydrogenase|nr:NAD(P)/FAD-dependent oxidoreductase [Steroidobacteraceae bacterium]